MKYKVLLVFAVAVLAGTLVLLLNDENIGPENLPLVQTPQTSLNPVLPSKDDRQQNDIYRAGSPATSAVDGVDSSVAVVPWWENQELLKTLQTSFLNEVEDYDSGWDENYEIAVSRLQKGVECPGILLEYVRLSMDDFLDLSPDQIVRSRNVLAKIGSNRMKLGADPFGEREQDGIAQSRLEEKILADGLAYGPEYMLDALTYRTGDVPWTDEQRREFASIRLKFLLELIPIETELYSRKVAAAGFMAKRAPDALRESGFIPGLNALDPQRIFLEQNLQDLNQRYLEESRLFVRQ